MKQKKKKKYQIHVQDYHLVNEEEVQPKWNEKRNKKMWVGGGLGRA